GLELENLNFTEFPLLTKLVELTADLLLAEIEHAVVYEQCDAYTIRNLLKLLFSNQLFLMQDLANAIQKIKQKKQIIGFDASHLLKFLLNQQKEVLQQILDATSCEPTVMLITIDPAMQLKAKLEAANFKQFDQNKPCKNLTDLTLANNSEEGSKTKTAMQLEKENVLSENIDLDNMLKLSDGHIYNIDDINDPTKYQGKGRSASNYIKAYNKNEKSNSSVLKRKNLKNAVDNNVSRCKYRLC
ncbi:9438_t:CDS:2, partial [Gigaspora margarita]